jgi:hypothetical protein
MGIGGGGTLKKPFVRQKRSAHSMHKPVRTLSLQSIPKEKNKGKTG